MNNLNLGRLGGQLGIGLCLLGFLVLFFGWNGAASQDYLPAQIPYLISGGAAGLGIVVVGAALVVVQNHRLDRARLEAVLERLAAAQERQGAGAVNGAAAPGAPAGLGGYVVAGESSYHRVDCTLHEARDAAHLVPLEDVMSSRLEPCRVCRPPQFGRLVPQS
ncbi:MAG TPA: hypothetical protein VFV40_07770 [Nocardioides sp.]|nr:hypothetical protein [Nocardioides sp.]